MNSVELVKRVFACLFACGLVLCCSKGDTVSSSAKNLILVHKDIMEKIGDVEYPEKEKGLTRVNIVALRGEYEPFTFSVYSVFGCNRLSVAPASLKRIDAETVEIGPEHIEIRCLKRAKISSYVNDWILAPVEGRGIEKGKSIRIWVTVHVPESTLPGTYKGILTISPGKGRPVTVPITLKVLPQKIEDPPDVQFAVLYTVSPFGQYFKQKKYTQLEAKVLDFYKNLRAHGMTSISPKCSDWPYRKRNIEGLKAEVHLATKAGLKGPVLWYMSALINGAKGGERYAHYDGKCDNWNENRDLANLREIIAITKDVERKEKWPEVIFITVDEPGTNTEDRCINNLRMEILEKSLRVVSELGARGATTVTELVDNRHNKAPFSRTRNELRRFWDRVRPFCQIRIYGYGYPQGETDLYGK